MNVQQLINAHVKYCFKHIFPVSYTDSTMSFRFSLPIAMTVNDKEILKLPTQRITYARNGKKGIYRYIVTLSNVNDGYPLVSNSKHFSEVVTFNLSDLVKQLDLKLFLIQEYEKLFRELKSELILQKIGELTKKWSEISAGKYPTIEQPYGQLKYSYLVDSKLRAARDEEVKLPF